MSLPKWVQEAKKIREAATPGPWYYDVGNHTIETIEHRMEICNEVGISERLDDLNYRFGSDDAFDIPRIITDPYHDFEFIAQSPQTQERLERALELAIEALQKYSGSEDWYIAQDTLAQIHVIGDEK